MSGPKITDTDRLNKLVEMLENEGVRFSPDFAQMLFFAKGKKYETRWRKAIDQWIKDGR